MHSRDKLIVACITASALVGIGYWIQPKTMNCPTNIPIEVTGETEARWGDFEDPYFSATITETDEECSVDEAALPSLVMTINVTGAGHILDSARTQVAERLRFDIIIKALDKQGATLNEQFVTKTIDTKDISTDTSSIDWSHTIKLEAEQIGRFDRISVHWAY